MQHSTSILTDIMHALAMGDIKKVRLEVVKPNQKFLCALDYGAAHIGSTLEQACKKAMEVRKKTVRI